MQNLVKKEYKIPFILVTSLFFLWGFAHAILDVLNKHFQDVLVITRAHSAWVQVMFYLGYFVMAIPAGLFMCGRFAGSWIMRYIRAEKVLFVCAIGTVVSTSLVVLDLGILSLIALFLGYVFEAIMFPTIFALSLRGLGNYTKRASSYLMMSPIGGAVGPLMMGYVADQTNMSFSFIVPLLSFIVVLLYAWKVKQRSFC